MLTLAARGKFQTEEYLNVLYYKKNELRLPKPGLLSNREREIPYFFIVKT